MNKKINNFDRIGDWKKFAKAMEAYIETPQKKYGTEMKFNDLCHYTGLRIMLWNILKYALRLWSGAGKEHDFEKIAHYAQMSWQNFRNTSIKTRIEFVDIQN